MRPGSAGVPSLRIGQSRRSAAGLSPWQGSRGRGESSCLPPPARCARGHGVPPASTPARRPWRLHSTGSAHGPALLRAMPEDPCFGVDAADGRCRGRTLVRRHLSRGTRRASGPAPQVAPSIPSRSPRFRTPLPCVDTERSRTSSVVPGVGSMGEPTSCPRSPCGSDRDPAARLMLRIAPNRPEPRLRPRQLMRMRLSLRSRRSAPAPRPAPGPRRLTLHPTNGSTVRRFPLLPAERVVRPLGGSRGPPPRNVLPARRVGLQLAGPLARREGERRAGRVSAAPGG